MFSSPFHGGLGECCRSWPLNQIGPIRGLILEIVNMKGVVRKEKVGRMIWERGWLDEWIPNWPSWKHRELCNSHVSHLRRKESCFTKKEGIMNRPHRIKRWGKVLSLWCPWFYFLPWFGLYLACGLWETLLTPRISPFFYISFLQLVLLICIQDALPIF